MSRVAGVSDLACNETLSVDDGDRVGGNASVAVTRRFQVAPPTNQNFRVSYPNHQIQQQQVAQQQRTYTASIARPVASRSYTVANPSPAQRSIVANTVHPTPGPSQPTVIPIHRGFQPPAASTAKIVRSYTQAGTADHEHGAVTFTTHSPQPHVQPTPQLVRNSVLSRGDVHAVLPPHFQQQQAVVQNPFVNSLRLTQAPAVQPSGGSKTAQGVLASVQQMRPDPRLFANQLYRTSFSPPQPQARIAGAAPIIPHPRFSALNNGSKLVQPPPGIVRFQTNASPASASVHLVPPPSSPALHRVQATAGTHIIQASGSGLLPHASPTHNMIHVGPGVSTPSPRPSILRKCTTPGSAAKRKLPFMCEPTQNGSPNTPSPSVRNIIQTANEGSNSVARMLHSVAAGVANGMGDESPRKRPRKQQFDTSTHEPIMMAVGEEPIKKPIWELERNHPLAQEYYKTMVMPEKKKRGRPRSDSRPSTAVPDQFYVQTGVRRVFVPLEGLDKFTPRTGPEPTSAEMKILPRPNIIASNRSSTNSAPPPNAQGPSTSKEMSTAIHNTPVTRKSPKKLKDAVNDKSQILEKSPVEKKIVVKNILGSPEVNDPTTSKQPDGSPGKKKEHQSKKKEKTAPKTKKNLLEGVIPPTPADKQALCVSIFLAGNLFKAQKEKKTERKIQKVVRARGTKETFPRKERQTDEPVPSTSYGKPRTWTPPSSPIARSNHFRKLEKFESGSKQAFVSIKIENFANKSRRKISVKSNTVARNVVKETDKSLKKFYNENGLYLPTSANIKKKLESALRKVFLERTAHFAADCVPIKKKKKLMKVKKKKAVPKTTPEQKDTVEVVTPSKETTDPKVEEGLVKTEPLEEAELKPDQEQLKLNGDIVVKEEEDDTERTAEDAVSSDPVSACLLDQTDCGVTLAKSDDEQQTAAITQRQESTIQQEQRGNTDDQWAIEQILDEMVGFVSKNTDGINSDVNRLADRTVLRAQTGNSMFQQTTWNTHGHQSRQAKARQQLNSFDLVLETMRTRAASPLPEDPTSGNVAVPNKDAKVQSWWKVVSKTIEKKNAPEKISDNDEPSKPPNLGEEEDQWDEINFCATIQKRKTRCATGALSANQMYEIYCEKVDSQKKLQERVLLTFEKVLQCCDPAAYNKLQLEIIRDREFGDSPAVLHKKKLQRLRMTLMLPPVQLPEDNRPPFGDNCSSVIITPSEELTNTYLKNQSPYWRGPPLSWNPNAIRINPKGVSQALRPERYRRLVSGDKELYLEDVAEYDNPAKLNKYLAMADDIREKHKQLPSFSLPSPKKKFVPEPLPTSETSRRTAFFKPSKEITFLRVAPKTDLVFTPADVSQGLTKGDPVKIAKFAKMREMLATTFKAIHTTSLMMEQTRDIIMCGLSPTRMELRTTHEEPEEEEPPPPPPEKKVVRAGKKAMKHKAALAKAQKKETPKPKTPKHPRAPRTPVITESTFERQIRRAIQESLKSAASAAARS